MTVGAPLSRPDDPLVSAETSNSGSHLLHLHKAGVSHVEMAEDLCPIETTEGGKLRGVILVLRDTLGNQIRRENPCKNLKLCIGTPALQTAGPSDKTRVMAPVETILPYHSLPVPVFGGEGYHPLPCP